MFVVPAAASGGDSSLDRRLTAYIRSKSERLFADSLVTDSRYTELDSHLLCSIPATFRQR
jgi:hypothetical protein